MHIIMLQSGQSDPYGV